jgi:putative RNA 2'-phosphotransferase
MTDLYKKESKFLSYVLRHHPDRLGLKLDRAGWVSVIDLLRALRENKTPMKWSMLKKVVRANDKRFEFSEDGEHIRASQGHSLDVDLNYEAKTPPDLLYHGTAERFLPDIRKEGLQKRSHHHVHLSADKETARNVGQRHGKPVVLPVLAGLMENHEFFLSTNGVWLVSDVPTDFIEFPEE